MIKIKNNEKKHSEKKFFKSQTYQRWPSQTVSIRWLFAPFKRVILHFALYSIDSADGEIWVWAVCALLSAVWFCVWIIKVITCKWTKTNSAINSIVIPNQSLQPKHNSTDPQMGRSIVQFFCTPKKLINGCLQSSQKFVSANWLFICLQHKSEWMHHTHLSQQQRP